MSFIIGKDCIAAVKSELIDALYINGGCRVNVVLNGHKEPIILADFYSDCPNNPSDASGMAKAYLAELVKKLNGHSEDDEYI